MGAKNHHSEIMGNGKENSKKTWLSITIPALFALVACVFAYQANQIAYQANQIANQANELAEMANQLVYQSTRPTISATSEVEWHERKGSETIIVENLGPPLENYHVSLGTYIKIRSTKMDEVYLPLMGYLCGHEPEKVGDLLLTGSRENNVSDYDRIQEDFKDAASAAGYEAFMSRVTILRLDYLDALQHRVYGYYRIYTDYRSFPMPTDEYQDITDSAYTNDDLAEEAGVSLSLKDMDGEDLWMWYSSLSKLQEPP